MKNQTQFEELEPQGIRFRRKCIVELINNINDIDSINRIYKVADMEYTSSRESKYDDSLERRWVNQIINAVVGIDSQANLFYIATIVDFLCEMDLRRLRCTAVYADAILGKDRKLTEEQKNQAKMVMEGICND